MFILYIMIPVKAQRRINMSIPLNQVQQQDGESENSLFTNGWCHSGYIHPTVYDTRMKK